MPDGCSPVTRDADHNGAVRRFSFLLAVVALAGGCEWDGPSRDVRVVTSDPATADIAADGGSGGGTDATAGPAVSTPPADPLVPGLEDRPGAFGRLDMPATVAVVGDSLTVAATDEITVALSRVGVRAVIVDGRESRRMASGNSDRPSGISAIEDILDERRPDLWVVALGTNDVGAAVGADRFRTDVRETLAVIPPDAPVVWVDVWIRDRLDAVVEANAVLRRELAGRPAPTAVVDWFSSGSVDGVITGDGVHLTDAGQARFATEIADAVVALAVSTS
jgi:lysophospholipase L1-like esterase